MLEHSVVREWLCEFVEQLACEAARVRASTAALCSNVQLATSDSADDARCCAAVADPGVVSFAALLDGVPTRPEQDQEEYYRLRWLQSGEPLHLHQSHILGRHLWLLESLHQSNSGSCGYYCLHNAAQLVLAARSSTLDEAREHLGRLKSRTAYHMRASRLLSLLLERCKEGLRHRLSQSSRSVPERDDACAVNQQDNANDNDNDLDYDDDAVYEANGIMFPWTPRAVKSETLEREFVRYLLTHDPELVALGGTDTFVALPEVSEAALKDGLMPSEAALALSNRLDEMRAQPGSWVRAFLIGAVVHWVVLVVRKREGIEELEAIYLDSLNSRVLGWDDAALQRYVTRLYDPIAAKRKYSAQVRAWKERSYLLCLQAISAAPPLLLDCLEGKHSFITRYFMFRIDGLIESYRSVFPLLHSQVGITDQGASENDARRRTASPSDAMLLRESDWLERLIHWSTNTTHPSDIERLRDSLDRCDASTLLPKETIDSLLEWKQSVVVRLEREQRISAKLLDQSDEKTAEELLILRLMSVLEDLDSVVTVSSDRESLELSASQQIEDTQDIDD